MLTDDATLRRIENYLDNTMEKKDRDSFEKELKTNPELEHIHNQYATLIHGIRFSSRNNLLQRLRDIEADLEDPVFNKDTAKDGKVVSMWKKPWVASLAAAVTLLFIATIILLTGQRNVPPTELFAQSFTPYHNIVMATQRGPSDERNTLQKAFYAYDREDYDEALIYFEQLPEAEYDASVLFYMGNAYLADGKAEKAEDIFKNILKNHDQYNLQAEWYLALSYLKQGKKEEAGKVLKKLTEGENSYQDKAHNILRKF